jgi:hypothetical protein
MFKLIAMAAAIISLLTGCAANSSYGSNSVQGSNTAAMGAARSSGEGPSFNPVYGGAGN